MISTKLKLGIAVVLGIGLFAAGASVVHGTKPYDRTKLRSLSGGNSDLLGSAVATDGVFAVAGAYQHDESKGAIYIFEHNGVSWGSAVKKQPLNLDPNDQFGWAVDMDGDYIIIGAPYDDEKGTDAGAAYILWIENGFWTSWFKIYDTVAPAVDDWFGMSVAINGDFAIVGSVCCESDKGAAFVFERTESNVWTRRAKLTASDGQTDDYFGRAVDISGLYAVVGADAADGNVAGSGAAYVFQKPSPAWGDMPETAKLTYSGGAAGDWFGCSIALEGDDVVVGAPNATVTVSTAGAAFVFEKPSGGWVNATETDTLVADGGAAGDHFGWSVDMVGDFVLVGAPDDDRANTDAGSLHLFKRRGSVWETKMLTVGGGAAYEQYGAAVSLSDAYLLGGMPGHDDPVTDAGSAFIYTRPVFDSGYFMHLADLHALNDTLTAGLFADNEWEKVLRDVVRRDPPPDFVAVSGDLVDWGENVTGRMNYNRLVYSDYLEINPTTGVHFLVDPGDASRRIPIYFSPGNHDYREALLGPTSRYPFNYLKMVNNTSYNFALLGQYAIFTLDSRYDKEVTGYPWRPEGKGPSDNQMDEFFSDVRTLDDEYISVVIMHHPHDTRKSWPFDDDEEFIENKSSFVKICKKYGVDYVLYGHCHKNESYRVGNTRCYITDTAKDGKKKKISVRGSGPEYIDSQLIPTFEITYVGDVDSYMQDYSGNRTGLYDGPGMAVVEIGVPRSTYYRYSDVSEETGVSYTRADMSVEKTDLESYDFVAEALSEGVMTIVIQECDTNAVCTEVVFENVPMYYNEWASGNQGTIATLTATDGVLDYTLTIVDPGNVARDPLEAGVQWSVRDVDLFQDTFPANGMSIGTGRVDAAVNIAPPGNLSIVPGDSAVATVFDPVSGILTPDPYTGTRAAVYLYLARDSQVDPPANPMPLGRIVADSDRWPVVDSVVVSSRKWYMFRADTCSGEPDKYSFDLNDNFFTNGDTLWFFFGARNNNDVQSWWTQEAGAVGNIAAASETAMEMQILPGAGPARGGDILFVDNLGAGDDRPFFEWTFEMLGIADQVDRFDKRGPSFCEGNSLGGRVTDPVSQLVHHYRRIIWNSGNEVAGTIGDGSGLPEKADDFAVLSGFLEGEAGIDTLAVYFSGNNLAEEWDGLSQLSAVDFRYSWMPFRLEDRDFKTEFGNHPLLAGESGGMFDHFGVPDTVIGFGALLDTNSFDVISAIGSSTIQMSYLSPVASKGGAVISFDSTNYYSSKVKVVLSGLSYHYITDYGDPSGTPDRADHLRDILTWLGNPLDAPVAAEEQLPPTSSLSQNYPNPFNPTTTIRYSIVQSGHVSLRIYNVAGQLVKTLVDEPQHPQAGEYSIRWDGRNNKGSRVSSGVYFYRLKTPGFTRAKKMVLLQ